jgi:hypothetical protein
LLFNAACLAEEPINKTDYHNITEILLTVALNTITPLLRPSGVACVLDTTKIMFIHDITIAFPKLVLKK